MCPWLPWHQLDPNATQAASPRPSGRGRRWLCATTGTPEGEWMNGEGSQFPTAHAGWLRLLGAEAFGHRWGIERDVDSRHGSVGQAVLVLVWSPRMHATCSCKCSWRRPLLIKVRCSSSLFIYFCSQTHGYPWCLAAAVGERGFLMYLRIETILIAQLPQESKTVGSHMRSLVFGQMDIKM